MAYHTEGCGLPQKFVCEKCGAIVHPEDYREGTLWKNRMTTQSVCFECAYWLDLIEHPVAHFQIINHQYFSLPPEVDEGEPIHHILTHSGHLFDSTRLFNYGRIPERFWQELPNTANFLSHSRYRTIKANQEFECDRKGCWDRKHCLWYKGPIDWNEIPESHKVGAEQCPMFINILNPKK